jgi:phenol 2-monooxygenase
MQYHLDGYKTGDPFIADPYPSVAERPEGLPGDVDVLIIGCGPAGLVLAAQMASFAGVSTAVIDRKDSSARPTGSTRSVSGGRTRKTRPR